MASEYIRRQDAIIEMMDNDVDHAQGTDGREVVQILSDIPAADVVPVVRCKDCKHFYFADNRIPQEQRYVCEISGEIWKPDSFCSYGERREE